MGSFWNDRVGKADTRDYHLFECSHPYMIELGLGSFTTGTLYEWWNEKTGDGVFLNRLTINRRPRVDPNADPEDPPPDLKLADPEFNLGSLIGLGDEPSSEFFWYGWKPTPEVENDGIYKRWNLTPEYGESGSDDLPSEPWEFVSSEGEVTWGSTELDEDFINNQLGTYDGEGNKADDGGIILGYGLNDEGSGVITAETLVPREGEPFLDLQLGKIFNIIQLNRYMIGFEDLYPKALWQEDDPETINEKDYSKLVANHEFLVDVQSSKGGPYIQWSGEVTFYVNENDGLISCPIKEWIPFKLYLFNNSNAPTETVGVASTNTTFVGPKVDTVTGKRYGLSEDGTWAQGNPDQSEDQVAADLDMGYNPVTKKWEAGTTNVIAKISQTVPRSKAHPRIDDLETQDTKEVLEDEDEEPEITRFIPGSGLAMPIRVQNGNKLQWAPNYAEPEETRCESESQEKEQVKCFNFSRNRTFQRGEEVLLSKIDDTWIVSELAFKEEEEEESVIVTPGIGAWGEFTQFITNHDYWFTASNGQTNYTEVTPELMELDFHQRYYGKTNAPPYSSYPHNDDYNLNYQVEYAPGQAGYIPNLGFKTKDRLIFFAAHNYLQSTSFDFLDTQICGKRGTVGGGRLQSDECAITSTRSDVTCAGTPYPNNDGNFKSSAVTHSFFGAVFVGGYKGVSTDYPVTSDTDRRFTIKPFSSGELVDPSLYLSAKESVKVADSPFEAGDGFYSRNATYANTQKGSGAHVGTDTWGDDPDFVVQGAYRYRMKFYKSTGSDNTGPNPFYAYKYKGDESFSSMPADVMTLSAPRPESEDITDEDRLSPNMSSLYPMHRFKDFHTTLDTDVINESKKAPLTAVWLGKVAVDGQNPLGNNQSAFGFTPRSNTIQFRPCRMEHFIQYGAVNKSSVGEIEDWFDRQGFQGGAGRLDEIRESRKFWNLEANTLQRDNSRPAQYGVESREEALNANNIIGDSWDSFFNSEYGVKWGGELTRQIPARATHKNYWTANTIGAIRWNVSAWPDNPTPGGAGGYGVITTYCKIAANEKIAFNVANKYGMGYWRSIRDFIIGAGSPQTPSWGSSTPINTYKQPDILIDLSARVYHSHPKSQTLYDPRFMSVHHFNPDVRYAFDRYTEDNGNITELDPIRNIEKEPFKFTGQDNNGAPIKFYYNIPVPSSTVDLRVPSRFQFHRDEEYEAGTTHPDATSEDPPAPRYDSVPASNTLVYSDATQDTAGGTFNPPLMADRFWQIDTRRVGKLLPYKYQTSVIGCGFVEGQEIVYPNDYLNNQDFDKTPVSNTAGKMIYDGSEIETGFAVGDVVGKESKGILFEVDAVYSDGGIERLTCIKAGNGFEASNFAGSGDVLASGDQGEFKFDIVFSVNGSNLNFSTAVGRVYGKTGIDKKPILLNKQGETTFRVCSPKIRPPNIGRSLDDPAETAAIIEEDSEVIIDIDPLYYSSNKNYDVFLHFHNEITSTWMSSGPNQYRYPWGSTGNEAESTEQSLTMSIIAT